jgi:hypothetical protein
MNPRVTVRKWLALSADVKTAVIAGLVPAIHVAAV